MQTYGKSKNTQNTGNKFQQENANAALKLNKIIVACICIFQNSISIGNSPKAVNCDSTTTCATQLLFFFTSFCLCLSVNLTECTCEWLCSESMNSWLSKQLSQPKRFEFLFFSQKSCQSFVDALLWLYTNASEMVVATIRKLNNILSSFNSSSMSSQFKSHIL